jgi:hypothetical protein
MSELAKAEREETLTYQCHWMTTDHCSRRSFNTLRYGLGLENKAEAA